MKVALVARVMRGLEWVAADEIDLLPTASEMEVAPREVRFSVADLDPGVWALRSVDDLFVRVGVVHGVGRDRRTPKLLAESASRLDLGHAVAIIGTVRPLPLRPAFDVVASIDGDRRFNRYDVEDALGVALGPALGGPFGSRRDGPPPRSDLSLRVVISGERAELGIRLAERPLHRRGWKQDTARGTLHPPAAAALLRLVGPVGCVIDPFCGDGTILIEAALSGAHHQPTGSDLDVDRLGHARANAMRAGVAVRLIRADASHGPWPAASNTAWVTNPPWNRTVAAAGGVTDTLAPAWAEAARTLGASGTLAVIADHDLAAATTLRASGWRPVVTQQIRLVGRLCQLVIAIPRDGPGRDPLSGSLRGWRARAEESGTITETGF